MERPFADTWIYVEFFLILSGFMTARHFCREGNEPINGDRSIVSTSAIYTFHKYVRFFPYVICAVLCEYLIRYGSELLEGNYYEFLIHMQEMPFEMLLLSAAGTNGTRLFPIWYLSATFLVSMISQIKNIHLKGLISFYPAVFYYLYRAHSIGSHTYPNQIVRAFCGMALGIVVFLLSDSIRKRSLNTFVKVILSVVLISSFLLLIIVGYKSVCPISTYLICFILIVALTFCEKTFIPHFSIRFFLYLGKLSMPMFIWHYVIAHLYVLLFPQSGVLMRILGYYFGTILVSIVSLTIFNHLFHSQKLSQ